MKGITTSFRIHHGEGLIVDTKVMLPMKCLKTKFPVIQKRFNKTIDGKYNTIPQ